MTTGERSIHRAGAAGAHPPAQGQAGTWVLLAALLLAAAVVYQPALHGGLLWDDSAHLTRSDLRGTDGLRRIWFDPGATQQYYPLVHSTFWLLHALWGDHTLGYHLVNVVLHALAAFVLALNLRRLAVPWPWLAAFMFALHPVHVESVAWMTQLKNVLSGVLFLGAALAYLEFDRAREASSGWSRRRNRMYWLALGLFVLALLSKTVTASLPVLLLVVFWWRRGRLDRQRDVLPLVPFFVLAAAFGSLTVWAEHTLIGARGAEFGLTIIERVLVAGRAVWFYAGKLFWPATLTFIYPRWEVSQGIWWQYLYPAGVIAVVAALWLWRRRSRAPLAAALFFVGALFPALGFVNVYPFRYSFVADHFQYLASIGIIVLVSGSVTTVLERRASRHRWLPAAAAIVILGPLAFLTWNQSRDYADAETLYRATIERAPSSWMAHNNLAVLLLPGSAGEATAHIDEALKYNPNYPEAHNNRGLALQLLGRFDEAVAAHTAALRLEPGFADAHNNLGTALQKMGRFQEASVAYREALRLRPDYPPGHVNLGNVLLEMGRFDEAISSYRSAIRIDPALANVHYNLATALEKTGQREEAMAEYEATLRIEPGSADAHASMGRLLEHAGRVAEAVSHYEAGVRLDPGAALPRLRLGNALYRMGNWQGAAAAFDAAVARAPESGDAHNNFGACLERLGRMEEAVGQYREAVRLLPDSAGARANLTRATALLARARKGGRDK